MGKRIDEGIAQRNVVEGTLGISVKDKLKRCTKQLKGKAASKRETKNTVMNLANENVSYFPP